MYYRYYKHDLNSKKIVPQKEGDELEN